MPTILHFADAHIDMANYGRHDPQSGLPLRVLDFLKSLDTIVDAAIAERVDLVLFAGDAYKDRSPAPTYQREWGKRIMRLSRAGIPTLLLVGNHDLSPAMGRAHALDPFTTLEVPNVRVIDKPMFLGREQLAGLGLQVLALPWIGRSGLMANLNLQGETVSQVNDRIQDRLGELIASWLEEADPSLPVVLAAHATVQGAQYGGERMVMLGSDLALPPSLVRNPRLDYVALGHIHKAQNLNPDAHPPVIYPGSIERVDFGEVADDKFYVLAHVERGKTTVEWRKLTGVRPFIDIKHLIKDANDLMDKTLAAFPSSSRLEGAIFRMVIEYPRELEPLIDENALRQAAENTFEFHLVKRPLSETRVRLPEGHALSELNPLELLDQYWAASHVDDEEQKALHNLAAEVIGSTGQGEEEN
ncbi:MAG TPA: exonuclease SbcCD subunit D [Anaerolineales bacterium]|nr:exonuclease SbcCD subunit D [Anaerolineales bacterium]